MERFGSAITQRRLALGVFLSIAGLLVGCGEDVTTDRGGAVSRTREAVEAAPPTSLTLALPDNMAPQRVPIAATRSLQVRDRAKIKAKLGGYAPIVSTGATETFLGVEAITGNVWSQSSVRLSPRTRVEGFVRTAGSVFPASDAVVTGGLQANTALGTLRNSTWSTNIPPNSGGSIALEPNQSRQLSPTGYGTLSVKSSATLVLTAGTYGFESWQFESGSKLVIDDSAGPVVVYVRGTTTWRGQVTKQGDASAVALRLLLVPYGTSTAFVEAPFKGTVFTPNGGLVLQPSNGTGEHYGAFFGQDVTVEAGVVVNHRAFPWSTVLPPDTVTMTDTPVTLRPTLPQPPSNNGGSGGTGGSGGSAGSGTAGSGGSGGSSNPNVTTVSLPDPISFKVPKDIWAVSGNAGNGTVRLTFSANGNAPVVCTYIGGSSNNTPTTDLDFAKGLRYLFESCTGNVTAGQQATGDVFELEIVSAATNYPKTTVDLHLGEGCSGSLPPPLTPDEVVVLRDNFNWRTTGALEETDPEGYPALWHGLVYIDRPEQLRALERWKVYWSTMPLSSTYAAQFDGQCGRVEHATDGKGLVVYAVFPAKLFNILRTFSIEARLKNAEPPFQFIVPTTPDEPDFTNSDGSLRYATLSSSGYAAWLASRPPQQPWFGSDLVSAAAEAFGDAANWIDDNIIDPAGDVANTGFSYVGKGWDEVVDWTANAVDNTWETIQSGLGDFAGLLEGNVAITLDVHMQNRDPLFGGSPMVRGWGRNIMEPLPNGMEHDTGVRPPLLPRGAFVSIRQWGFGFLPVMNQERLPGDGSVTIHVVEGAEARGGNGLCFELENDDALMTTDFAPNEVCNFSGPVFDDFEHDKHTNLYTNQKDLHALSQIVDGADYARTVIGWNPWKMDVLIGGAANHITGLLNDFEGSISAVENGDSRAMCLCLDYPGVGAGAIPLLAGAVGTAIPGIQIVGSPLILKDLWWPDDVAAPVDSRGVMTHEYGHFLMCDLLFRKGEGEGATGPIGAGGPVTLSALVPRILEGNNDSRDDEIALVTESWADAFAMQVVGGANYIRAQHSTQPEDFDHRMGFCNGPHCMEFNYQGGDDYDTSELLSPGKQAFLEELAKVESTIHDAFDSGNDSRRLTSAPSNGDIWLADAGGTMRFASASYLAVEDEPVALDGAGWKRWVDGWLSRGGHPLRSEYFGGLSDAMAQQNATWCDRCEVFAVHEFLPLDPMGSPFGDPTLYATGTFSSHFERWQICNQDPHITTWLGGDPPERHLNLDASCEPCGPLQFSNEGTCTACALQEVPRGDHCEACPLGTMPDPSSNECIACDPNEISVGGECIQCPLGETADRTTNACVPCPADAIVNLDTQTTCGSVRLTTTTFQGEGDLCPLDYWIEVQNLQRAIENECDVVSILVEPVDVSEPNPCETRTAKLTVFDAHSSLSLLDSSFGSGTWDTNIICGINGCVENPNCTYPTRYVIDENQLSVGIDTVRVLASAEGPTGAGGRSAIPAEVMVSLDDVGDIR